MSAVDPGLAGRVLKRALAGGGDFAEAYFEDSEIASFRLDDGHIEVAGGGGEAGLGLRVISGDVSAYAYSTHLEESSLLNMADNLSRALKSSATEARILLAQPERSAAPQAVVASTVAAADKIRLLWRCDQTARSYGSEIRQVGASYFDLVRRIAVVNSEGWWSEEERHYVRLIMSVVAARGELLQTALEAPAGQAGFEFFESNPPEQVAKRAAERALTMLDAELAPTGTMPVVLAPGSGGVLFHEACGHGLEADIVAKGSVYQGKLGETVGSPAVTLIDDPTLPQAWGSYHWDDEGTPARQTVLVEKGVLRSYLCDRLFGRQLGLASTGNGRREDYRHLPIPRMSNIFLAPGDYSPEEVIGSVDEGLFARKLGGGEVNPETGEFVFSVSEGYRIRRGKLGPPVRGATLVGNGPTVLRSVRLVAGDLGFDPGTCGKEGQGVPVTCGQPTMSIEEMTVGGTRVEA